MKKTYFGLHLSMLMLMLLLVSGTSVYAQKPILNDYTQENNYYLNIRGLGLRLIADGPETVVTNSKGQSATITELETMGDQFEFVMPITIKNATCENTLVALYDKEETSREDIVKLFTEYMFEGEIIRKDERVFDVVYSMDNEGSLASTNLVFATHQNEAQSPDRYVVKTLYDVRFIPVYAILETRQNPSATTAAVDSVATRNGFEKSLLNPESLMTQEEADSIGDGYNLLPIFMSEVVALFEKHGMRSINSVEDGLVNLAMMYNDAVGHFPPSFTATHKEFVAKEEAKHSQSIMVQNNMPAAPMGNFTASKKPAGSRVTITAGPATEITGPQFDSNGHPVIINPLQNNQRKFGTGASIQVKW